MRISLTRRSLLAALLAAGGLTLVHGQKPAAPPRRIAVFGSSVANGTGDNLGLEGYTGRLRTLLAPRGWEVLNQSRGGDNTRTMAPRFAPEGAPDPKARYLVTVNPGYALLGLSLGNEGIQNGTTTAEKDAIYAQFAAGMRGFVERSRQHHIVPIITLCYTRNDFTAVEYAYTRRMNLTINAWDVPSVNFLGAVDDGTGKWARGFWHDSLHPNAAGHAELARTFVPTLFDALQQDKPAPVRSTAAGFAHLDGGTATVTFTPDASMHPFAFAVTVRASHDGTIATIAGVTLEAATSTRKEERAGGRGTLEFESTTLTPSAAFAARLAVANGVWTYTSADGTPIASAVKADATAHHLVVSHYTARGETLFFVDGALAGSARERLEPRQFTLGGSSADYRDLLVYRSALNGDEVAALEGGALLQASLEVYSPLTGVKLRPGGTLPNLAQSLAPVRFGPGGVK